MILRKKVVCVIAAFVTFATTCAAQETKAGAKEQSVDTVRAFLEKNGGLKSAGKIVSSSEPSEIGTDIESVIRPLNSR